jgi:hypothetical protein
MFNFLLGRPSGGQELKLLVQHLTAANAKMAARGKSAQRVGETLAALIQSEAPSFAVFFEKIQEIYTKLSLNYETASKEQARAIDDLNDIVVRTPVFERISSERDIAKKDYDHAHENYRRAKAEAQNHPTQETIVLHRNSRIERARVSSVLIEKTEVFVAYRARVTRFIQKRSQSAWLRYGLSIERTAKVEGQLMGELTDLCRRLRDNVESPHLILQTAEQVAGEMPFAEMDFDEAAARAQNRGAEEEEENPELPSDGTDGVFRTEDQ